MLSEHDFLMRSRLVPLPTAIGCLAAETIELDDAKTPVLLSGQRIGWDQLMYLARVTAKGAICTGATDPRLLTIRVIDENMEYERS